MSHSAQKQVIVDTFFPDNHLLLHWRH